MKNKIYTYFFKEFFSLFLLILFTLTIIVWTVQAVNYLDLVTQDGHSFSVYFAYSLLGLPKTITRLLPLTFLVSLMLVVLRFDRSNELIVLWTSGLNKMKMVNIILLISFFITFFQLVTASTISPTLLNYSRQLLKKSDLKLFPSLLKEKKFNDTVRNLTVFVEEKKSNGAIKNIFIRDDTKKDISQTIFAKSGFIKKTSTSSVLVLYDGVIQREKIDRESSSDGQINSINFDATTINLSKYATKTTTWPKVQEKTSLSLIKCLFFYNPDTFGYTLYTNDKNITSITKDSYNENFLLSHLNFFPESIKNCPYKYVDVINELNRRFGMPLYIPIISLVCCLLLASRKENKLNFTQPFVFCAALIILIVAEVSVRYSGKIYYIAISYYILPLIILSFFYLILYLKFKNENLKN